MAAEDKKAAEAKTETKKETKTETKEEKAEDKGPRNELRVGPQRAPKVYISQAIDLLENGESEVVLKGRGKAVSAVVNIAEVVKRRVKGLHQVTAMESMEVTEAAGADKTEKKKYICGLKVTLSTKALDKSAPGYQEPLPEDVVTEEKKELRERRRQRPAGGAPKGGERSGRGASGRKTGGRGAGGRGGGAAAGGRGGRGASGGRSAAR